MPQSQAEREAEAAEAAQAKAEHDAYEAEKAAGTLPEDAQDPCEG